MKSQNILILLIILLVFGGVFYFINVPELVEQPESRTFVWLIEQDDIEHVTISLPREGLSESFIKISSKDEFPWFFDDAEKSAINAERWGGGIPLLLSGPGADRVITEDASPEKLAEFGLDEPSMKITLTLTGGRTLDIDVGDNSPNGQTYYVRAPNTNGVAIVDASWYNVLSRLVTDPPYAQLTE